jgi:hypothetical protein
MSQLRVSSIASNAGTQSVSQDRLYRGAATAWVNFNGTGTVAIRDSYNVSSITDLGVGQFRANFQTALSNANYVVVSQSNRFSDGTCYDTMLVDSTVLTTSVQIETRQSSSWGVTDREITCLAIFGGY